MISANKRIYNRNGNISQEYSGRNKGRSFIDQVYLTGYYNQKLFFLCHFGLFDIKREDKAASDI
jgi:hypothetical protein